MTQKRGGETLRESNTQINFPRRETRLYSSAVWNGSKCSKVFRFFGEGTFRTLKCFITSHCSSLPQSLYDKTHTLQKEQLVYNFIPPPFARRMLFIRTWLRAAQEHNSTDPPVFDSEEIVDLKYQASVTNSPKIERLQCYVLAVTFYCLCSWGSFILWPKRKKENQTTT